MASGVIVYPNRTIELVLKDGTVLPLSGMQKPKTPGPSQSSQLSRSSSRPQSPRLQRCAWCDSQEHTKSKCSEFKWAKMSGRVYLNDANHVKYWVTATELPQMIGKGGIMAIYEQLLELEKQLGLDRDYDPLCVSILRSAIRSFSA